MKTYSAISVNQGSARAAVTLSEVLISLMVMSIGVVSLATLFPISVLKSIQATQLTNATIHRQNAEHAVKLFPWIIVNPDADNPSAGATYLSEHVNAGGADNPTGTLSRFVVDPLGWNSPTLSTVQSAFGNGGSGITNPISRYNGGFTVPQFLTLANMQTLLIPGAQELVFQPDSWNTLAKGTVGYIPAANSISVGANVDTQLIEGTRTSIPAGMLRIVLYSSDSRSSVTRVVTSAGGNIISWNDPASLSDDLPANGYSNIPQFRVEALNTRYSWLLTVRKPSIDFANMKGTAEVDVVVFHNRPLSVNSEQIFRASRGSSAYSLVVSLPASGNKPFLKKGGFLFDAENARWYRIQQYSELTNEVTLDEPVSAPIGVIGMPGVVEVYELGSTNVDLGNYLP